MYKRYELKGLCCANCAKKIEKLLGEQGYPSAKINFPTSELFLTEDNPDIEKITKIVQSVESDVVVISKEEITEKTQNKSIFDDMDFKELKEILLSSVLFILGFIGTYLTLEPTLIFLIFLASYVISGHKVLKKTFKNIKRMDFLDENFLMSIATIGAFLIGSYAEGVAVMLFYSIGEFLQDLAVAKSRKSIKSLVSLKAEYANLKEEGNVSKVSPETVKIGQTIVINPGERVPLDGIVISGYSSVDTTALTGESIPRSIKEGDEILSGMVNLNGLLTVNVTKNFKESTVSKILELIETANIKKAKTERFITKFARYYTPVMVLLALGLALIPPFLFNQPFSTWFYRALILLVISCPCALVLSIPLGYFASIGRLAKEGILVKGSNYIDVLSKTTYVSFDKTGTLTKGIFKVIKIVPMNDFSKEELLEIAATSESHSNHPVAKAILSEYGHNHFPEFEEYSEIAGKGIIAKINGIEVISGNSNLMKENEIVIPNLDTYDTVVHFAVDKKYAGHIIIADELKSDSKKAVMDLKQLGIKKVSMLTGDKEEVAKKISKELSLDEYYSELLPKDKVSVIEKLEEKKLKNETIAFVGEGINDAPVIMRADVGISMGTLGSDAAIESSDIVIMDDKPSKVPLGIKISKKTKKIAWQNITLIIIVKLAFIMLSIFGETTMWQAVFADVGIALISVFNALRILK